MGIDLQWENGKGDGYQMVSDSGSHMSEILAAAVDEGSLCLRFIDRFGDTVFNQSQLPSLKDELGKVPLWKLSLESQNHLRKLLNLIEQASGKGGTYLRFSGD